MQMVPSSRPRGQATLPLELKDCIEGTDGLVEAETLSRKTGGRNLADPVPFTGEDSQ